MKAKLVRIGNSRGVRLPKTVIDEAGLGEDLEIRVEGQSVVISSPKRPREGWAESARLMVERGEAGLLDPWTENRFDREEWEW
jgi:antitoxin MazE